MKGVFAAEGEVDVSVHWHACFPLVIEMKIAITQCSNICANESVVIISNSDAATANSGAPLHYGEPQYLQTAVCIAARFDRSLPLVTPKKKQRAAYIQ